MQLISVFIVFITTATVTIQIMELLHDTDNLPNAQYFDCLHYMNKFTNTYAIKYCIQPENISEYKTLPSLNNDTQCKKGTTGHWFSSLYEQGIEPNIVLSIFQSGIEQADRYAAFFLHKQKNDLSISVHDEFICK
jgi:hypothetical protein